MSARRSPFNTYLLLALLLGIGILTACQTPEERHRAKQTARLTVHLEDTTNQTDTNYLAVATIAGVQVFFNRRPMLTEDHLDSAALVGTPDGGYALQITFNDRGRLMLESVTAGNRSRRLIVFSEFGTKEKTVQRWLAAPKIPRRLTDGILIFTPDATREEAQDIVYGLLNVAHENKKPWVF